MNELRSGDVKFNVLFGKSQSSASVMGAAGDIAFVGVNPKPWLLQGFTVMENLMFPATLCAIAQGEIQHQYLLLSDDLFHLFHCANCCRMIYPPPPPHPQLVRELDMPLYLVNFIYLMEIQVSQWPLPFSNFL